MLSRSNPRPRSKSGDLPPPIAFVSLAPHFAASRSSAGFFAESGLGLAPGRSAPLRVTVRAKPAARAAVSGSGTATSTPPAARDLAEGLLGRPAERAPSVWA